MNLIKDGFEQELITSQPDFTIKVFIDLLNSEYISIQNLSLDILNVLTQQVKGNPVPKDFQDCGGVTKLLSMIKVSTSIDHILWCTQNFRMVRGSYPIS